jgi:hypothetical protein
LMSAPICYSSAKIHLPKTPHAQSLPFDSIKVLDDQVKCCC